MDSRSKVLLSTSRNPTPRIRTFCRDLSRVIPCMVRINRGKMSTDEVAEKALQHEADRVVIIDRWQGGPSRMKFYQVHESGLVLFPPTIQIGSIKLQREFGVSKVKLTSSTVIPEPNSSRELQRVVCAFSDFLGIPILSRDEIGRKSLTLMCFSWCKFNQICITFIIEPKHVEVGPEIIVSSAEW